MRWGIVALFIAGVAAAATTPVAGLAFHPDGALIVAHHDAVVVRSVTDGAVTGKIDADVRRVCAVAVGDGVVAIGGGTPGQKGKVVVWDWKTKRVVAEIEGFGDVVTAVAIDGRRLAAGSADGSARLWRLEARPVELARLTGHTAGVRAVAFGGALVATAASDRSVKVWEAGTGKLVRTLANHTAAVHALAVRPGAGPWTVASGGDDRTVRVWQPGIGRMVRIVRKHEGAVLALAYSADGATLYSAGAEGVVRSIDADGDEVSARWPAHDDWIYAIAVSADGKWVATGDWAGDVRVWDAKRRTRAW